MTRPPSSYWSFGLFGIFVLLVVRDPPSLVFFSIIVLLSLFGGLDYRTVNAARIDLLEVLDGHRRR